MVIEDKIKINASPVEVWPYVADPEMHELWNPKIKKYTPVSPGKYAVGFRYRMTYLMSNKEIVMEAEIKSYEMPVLFVAEMVELIKTDSKSYERRVVESYQLTDLGGVTLLEQHVEVINSGIHLFFRFLIWLIMKIGKPQGKRYLQKLKELVEER